MARKHNISFILMLVALLGLFGIQAFWIAETIRTHNHKIETALGQAGFRIKDEIERDFYCYILYTETNIGEEDVLAITQRGGHTPVDTLREYRLRYLDTILPYPKYAFSYPIPTKLHVELRFDYLIDSISAQNMAIPEVQAVADEYHTLAIIDSVTNTRVAYSSTLGKVVRRNLREVLPGIEPEYTISHAGTGREVYAFREKGLEHEILALTLYDDALIFPQAYILRIYSESPYLYVFRSIWHFLLVTLLIAVIGMLLFFHWLRSWRRERIAAGFQRDMMHHVSHELNTPVFNIRMAVESAQQLKNGSRAGADKYLGIIDRESERMACNMEMLMDYLRIEEKQFQLDEKTLEINELITNVVDLFRNREDDSAADIRFFPPGSRAMHVKGDEVHLVNLFYNLLDNAVKHTGDNPARIRIYIGTERQNVVVRVEDNCPLIPPGLRNKIFEKYYRLSGHNSGGVRGHGLGLYYVRLVLRKMKGSVRIEHSEMDGNAFVIKMPVATVKMKHHGK